METLIWTALFSPLISFTFLLVTSFFMKRKLVNLIGCASVLISFVCFIFALYHYQTGSTNGLTFSLFSWLPVDGINANFSIYVDALSLFMTLIIAGVGFLTHVYSIGYMEHDEDIARFFACMNLFIFMMLLLVLSSNLVLLLVGWEGVGLVSYLLIGYYYSRPSAAAAADNAFIVNRAGDLGLILAILLTLYLFGTSEIQDVIVSATSQYPVGSQIILILTLLFFIGATGKSAQLPLQVWLPEAMEGPTPVSALIHAATMVTAGVYLVVRLHDLFLLSPITLFVIGLIGVLTALYAALAACAQTDLKKVLAYSTISQLGYMFLACSVGAFYAAMFHLMTHAFIKALLFLSAGNVVHMMSGLTDMSKMGGLAKKFPVTNVLFLIGVLAMAGLPPLSAFYSKDLILEQTWSQGYKLFFFIGLISALLTAFYLMRAYILTFHVKANFQDKILRSITEAPRVMLIPVTFLSILAILSGYMAQYVSFTDLQEFLAKSNVVLSGEEHGLFNIETLMSTLASFFGTAFAYLVYTRYSNRIGETNSSMAHAFYISEFYNKVIVNPLKSFSEILDDVVEPDFFRGSINKTKSITEKISLNLQKIQSGQIRSYIAWIAIGTVLLIALFIS